MEHKRYNISVRTRGGMPVNLHVLAALPSKKFAPPSNRICPDRKHFSRLFLLFAFHDYFFSEEHGVSGVVESTPNC